MMVVLLGATPVWAVAQNEGDAASRSFPMDDKNECGASENRLCKVAFRALGKYISGHLCLLCAFENQLSFR